MSLLLWSQRLVLNSLPIVLCVRGFPRLRLGLVFPHTMMFLLLQSYPDVQPFARLFGEADRPVLSTIVELCVGRSQATTASSQSVNSTSLRWRGCSERSNGSLTTIWRSSDLL
jgi:hypothetical protein